MIILAGRPQIRYHLEILPLPRQLLPQLTPELATFLTESIFKESVNLRAVMRRNLNETKNTN